MRGTIPILLATLLVSVLACAATAFGPALRVTPRDGRSPDSAGITLEASDAGGLDSVDITDRDAGVTYHTALSRSQVNREFKRFFTISELFPDVSATQARVRLQIVVRNTKGETASAAALVRLQKR